MNFLTLYNPLTHRGNDIPYPIHDLICYERASWYEVQLYKEHSKEFIKDEKWQKTISDVIDLRKKLKEKGSYELFLDSESVNEYKYLYDATTEGKVGKVKTEEPREELVFLTTSNSNLNVFVHCLFSPIVFDIEKVENVDGKVNNFYDPFLVASSGPNIRKSSKRDFVASVVGAGGMVNCFDAKHQNALNVGRESISSIPYVATKNDENKGYKYFMGNIQPNFSEVRRTRSRTSSDANFNIMPNDIAVFFQNVMVSLRLID